MREFEKLIMQINRISNVNFTAGYDIHTHTGHWWTSSPQKTNGAIEISSGNYAYLKIIHQLILSKLPTNI